MHYYEVIVLKQNTPPLTYYSLDKIDPYTLVKVEVRGKTKEAVVLKEVDKPNFKSKEFSDTSLGYFTKNQIELAQFISRYYFSTLSQALSIFLPYKDCPKIHIEQKCQLPQLSKNQQKVYSTIKDRPLSLLFGVTGSGKTEIYIHLIADVLDKGKSALLLMPEIALTPQISKRLTYYFKDSVALWHSKLSKKKRQETLEKIQNGSVKVIIGARSALFLPIDKLGLIVVDEEHDDSYKASSNPRYNAKDLSIYIGKKEGIKVVLGSATPLVSSYHKFDTIALKEPYIKTKKRFAFIPGEEINVQIINAVKEHISRGEQVLIFVPTRANFKYLICNSCGKTHTCPYCSIGMSIHTKRRVLQCHYCNFSSKIPNGCDYCSNEQLITKRVGTSEVKELIEQAEPNAKFEIFDRDNITTASKLAKALKRVNSAEANVLIGTQMLSKGHDYPNITLSVILGLDFIAAIGDYRAKERAIALMHQIAGRSGRAKDATILIQTSQPDFYRPYLTDYEEFLRDELPFREPLYPPFSNIARVLIANKIDKKALHSLDSAVDILKRVSNIEIVGYGAAPIEKIANKWRFNILLRANKKSDLLKALRLVANIDSIDIDMDPVEFS